MGVTTTALLLAWLAILILALAMAGLLRQLEEIRHQLPRAGRRLGPALNQPAPSIQGLEIGEPMLLIFADQHCLTCERLLDALEADPDRFDLNVVALYRRDVMPNRPRILTLVGQHEAFARFGITLTPFAVLIDALGSVVVADVVDSIEALDRLVQGDPDSIESQSLVRVAQ